VLYVRSVGAGASHLEPLRIGI